MIERFRSSKIPRQLCKRLFYRLSESALGQTESDKATGNITQWQTGLTAKHLAGIVANLKLNVMYIG